MIAHTGSATREDRAQWASEMIAQCPNEMIARNGQRDDRATGQRDDRAQRPSGCEATALCDERTGNFERVDEAEPLPLERQQLGLRR
jgi:hypothetical protein